MSKGFRNIGAFGGPNIIGGTLDRKAMLESSSESSDTHLRAAGHLHHHQHAHHAHHQLRAVAAATGQGLYDAHGVLTVSCPQRLPAPAPASQSLADTRTPFPTPTSPSQLPVVVKSRRRDKW